MPYIINKTDGSIVANITDGTIDKSSTSLTLIGKNFKGIGEVYNENLVYLLENFANSLPPTRQIKGQLWFNSNSNKLNVYDGNNWRPVGSPFVSNIRPTDIVAGDLWIDKTTQQLKFYDGSNLIIAGPSYTTNQGRTGWITEEIIDRTGNSRVVASMYVGNVRVAIFNERIFNPLLAIPGFTTDITALKAGLTFSTLVENNNINAPAEVAVKLLDEVDGELDTTKFVRSDKSGSIDGSLTINNANGIIVGPNANFSVFIETLSGQLNSTTKISNRESNSKTIIEVKAENEFQTPIELDPVEKRFRVYPDDQWQTSGENTPRFDVNADTTIRGNLTVIGETQFTNSTTVQITDKNIELAVVGTPTNATANGAGITVLGPTGSNKTITWLLNSIFVDVNTQKSSWELNDNLKIPPTTSYHIGNSQVLSTTTLGSSVVTSSLTQVGNLIDLTAADFTLVDNKLTVIDQQDLIISIDETRLLTLENRVRITNVAQPFDQFDVANKEYVDTVKTNNNFVTVDVTGFLTPNTQVVPQINALFPSTNARLDDVIRVLCLSYSNLPTVSRILKVFKCDLVVGIRTWVYQPDQDVVL
jgi:hypothetical protein